MKLEVYNKKRNALMEELQNIANAESFDKDAFDSKKAEVEALDKQFSDEAQAQADIDALNNIAPSVNHLVGMEANPQADPKPAEADAFSGTEYRNAFMAYIQKGEAIPEQFVNQNQLTTTAETGAVIPTTIVQEIIKGMKVRGVIWNSVRKLNVQGGVQFPINDLIPVAHWITEAQASEDQKLSAKNSVTFSYYGLECKLAQSLLVSVTTLAEFESQFTEMATEAIITALEIGVFNGSGTGQMKGILNETRIPAGNTITLTAAEFGKWADWKKKVFAKMKKAYRNGTFYMAQSTFDGQIDGMVDTTGQPIGRVNYGIDGGEVYRFGGKGVETVEDDVIKSFDDAATGDVVAVFGDLKNYAVNTNLQMSTVKWVDHDTNKVKNKVIMIVDGKVLDPNGFLIIKKGA